MLVQKHPHLVLASASPRRRELLRYLGVVYSVIATQGEDEDRAMPPELRDQLPPYPLDPMGHPTLLAWRKCDAAREVVSGLILGADTIVVLDGKVLGKPRNSGHAETMLHKLAGRMHTVYTGVALLNTSTEECQLALDRAEVTMAELSDATIRQYVATGEPLDKAGAYGIQGLGGQLVRSVTGSFSCVIGLPLTVVYQVLQRAGFAQLVDPARAFEDWRAEHGKDGPRCTAP